ncbi:hypothetical protein GCM10028827_08020 [Mucilaginibacter myungsuensis]
MVAGNGISGSTAQWARLFVDSDGSIYVADISNARIVKWAKGATSGVTVAGGNGIGNAANQFSRPVGVTLDKDGNIYIADQNNNRIQKWVPGAASGTTVVSAVQIPTGICFDKDGNLFVSEQTANIVTKFSPDLRTRTVVAGRSNIYLSSPTGIFIDNNGDLYVCDTDQQSVFKFSPGSSNGTVVAGQLGNPIGITGDNQGNLYVTSHQFRGIWRIPIAQPSARTMIINNNIYSPDIWMTASGDLYLTDFEMGRVLRYPNMVPGLYTIPAPGVYTAKITTASGCTVTSNAITVLPPAQPKVSVVADNALSCAAYPATFTASAVNGGAAPSYQWQVNGVNAGSKSNNNVFTSATVKSGDKITCIMYSNALCIAETSVTSNTITITAPTETPTVSITSNSNVTCTAFPITFTATNAGIAPTYNWIVNGTAVPNSGNGSVFITNQLKSNDRVTCNIISNAQYCQTITSATSNTISVSAPVEVPTVSIASNKLSICQGEAITFTATATNSGNASVYTWLLNGSVISGAGSGNTYTSNKLANGDAVTCRVLSNAQYCQASDVAISQPVAIIIKPLLLPVISIMADLDKIYIGSTVTFSANIANAGTNPVYEWMLNGKVVAAGSTFTTNKLADGDHISCKLTNTTDCTSQSTVSSNTIRIAITYIVRLVPPNTFTPNGDGVNDTWNIAGMTAFPKAVVGVFNRLGQQLFVSAGYGVAWDGTYNGQPCTAGVYYYRIEPGNGSETISGHVTLIR